MDYLIKAIAFNKKIRAFVVITTDTVEEARRRHDTFATASAALGRTITSGVLFAGMLKVVLLVSRLVSSTKLRRVDLHWGLLTATYFTPQPSS
jgi:redox-regulated HSP33 family molecular chaperone